MNFNMNYWKRDGCVRSCFNIHTIKSELERSPLTHTNSSPPPPTPVFLYNICSNCLQQDQWGRDHSPNHGGASCNILFKVCVREVGEVTKHTNSLMFSQVAQPRHLQLIYSSVDDIFTSHHHGTCNEFIVLQHEEILWQEKSDQTSFWESKC